MSVVESTDLPPKPFGDKTCRHCVPLGWDCQQCLDYIRAIGRGEPAPQDWD